MALLSEVVQIEKRLYSYWDEPLTDASNPVSLTLEAWRLSNRDYSVGLISKQEVRAFLQQHFPVLHSYFDLFKIYCVRADIARFVHLYLHGGFYADTHVEFRGSLNTLEVDDAVGLLNKEATAFIVGDPPPKPTLFGLFYATKGCELLLKTLEVAQRRCQDLVERGPTKAGQYARLIHLAAGNGLFDFVNMSAAIASEDPSDPHTVGEYYRYLPRWGHNSSVFQFYENRHIFVGDWIRGGGKHWSILANEIDLL